MLFGGYRKVQVESGSSIVGQGVKLLVQAWGKSGRLIEKGNLGREGTRSNIVGGRAR